MNGWMKRRILRARERCHKILLAHVQKMSPRQETPTPSVRRAATPNAAHATTTRTRFSH
ncbi:MAG TPA: hypothetical protein VF666_01260 [Pyrinomonadaceae bacterium]